METQASWQRLKVCLLLLCSSIMGVSCRKQQADGSSVKLGEKLTMTNRNNATDKTQDIILAFTDLSDIPEALKKSGEGDMQVTALDQEGKILRVQGSSEELMHLDINSSTRATFNTPVRVTSHRRDDSLNISSNGQQELDLFTVRNVLGVDRLRERFPEANGSGIRVAVFDTGIDFGIAGLSQGREKLLGFYDMTGFGHITAQALTSKEQEHLRTTSHLPKNMILLSQGELSERQLARSYLTGEMIDINGNGSGDDTFPFLVGRDGNGELMLWIDKDRNGLFDGDHEILRDFNTHHSYLSMQERGAMGGIHQLAVTLTSEEEVQFHVVLHGHGTSCALIIGGDGYGNGKLMGLAPKTQFLSYTMDVIGQDVYTMDQFLQMFLHAKEQRVNAISISWGFSTADLSSARFVADFLDREIAQAGILIAIAAGNNGPGVNSAAADDYIPHWGLAVGAMISQAQATNVYKWVGIEEDAVVDYSSFGPTRGGRLAPDMVSPLVSLVRGHMGDEGDPFYGFSGTSSATPALVGASSALMSILKHQGYALNPRLLKLALENSAQKLENTMSIRQGSGLPDVSLAYDLYVKLFKEWQIAKRDASRSTPFAYELFAETSLAASALPGEGLYWRTARSSDVVRLRLRPETLQMIDEHRFMAPLRIRHRGDFFSTADMVVLQKSGAQFVVRYHGEKLAQGGLFADVIEIVRPEDELVLLKIPVVLQIPKKAKTQRLIARVDETLLPLGLWRQPIHLAEAAPLEFRSQVIAEQGHRGARLNAYIRAPNGVVVHATRQYLEGRITDFDFITPELPSGHYELLLSRRYYGPSVAAPIQVIGTYRVPRLQIQEVAKKNDHLYLRVKARNTLNYSKLRVKLLGHKQSLTLNRQTSGRQAFFGQLIWPNPVSDLSLALRQDRFTRYDRSFLHMSLVLSSMSDDHPLYRGWINFREEGSPFSPVHLSQATQELKVMAYPNIVHWQELTAQTIILDAVAYYPSAEQKVLELDLRRSLTTGQTFVETLTWDTFAQWGLESLDEQLVEITFLDKKEKVLAKTTFHSVDHP